MELSCGVCYGFLIDEYGTGGEAELIEVLRFGLGGVGESKFPDDEVGRGEAYVHMVKIMIFELSGKGSGPPVSIGIVDGSKDASCDVAGCFVAKHDLVG